MNIHAILTTNNEADILEACLMSAIKWAHNIYVFDTGSTDSTPEILSKLSCDYPQIIYYKSEYREYNFLLSNNEVFSHYFHLSNQGDWWCLLSTDEFYPEYVCSFISRVPPPYDCIWDLRVNFYFTDVDYDRFLSIYGSDLTVDSLEVHNFFSSLRHYKADYSEPRFFKHTPATFASSLFTPSNFPHACPSRILNFHYQYRFPAQIVRRVVNRQSIYRHSLHLRIFDHEANFSRAIHSHTTPTSYFATILSSRVVDSTTLSYLDTEGLSAASHLHIEHSNLPPLPLTIKILFFLLYSSSLFYLAKYKLAFTSRVDRSFRILKSFPEHIRALLIR